MVSLLSLRMREKLFLVDMNVKGVKEMYIKKTKIDTNWNQYDKVVALSHLNNFGAIYCEIEHGTPIDNEYEVEQYVSEEKVAKRGMLLSEYIEQFGDITISPNDIDLIKKNIDEVQPRYGETYWYIDSCGGVTEGQLPVVKTTGLKKS